jgi:hypothetical protein
MSGPVEEADPSSGSPPRCASHRRQVVLWATSSMAVEATALAVDLEWLLAARREPEGDMWLCGRHQRRAVEPTTVAQCEPKDERALTDEEVHQVFIFGSPLYSGAKMQCHLLELLEMNLARHSTQRETFLLLPPAAGVTLKARIRIYQIMQLHHPW